MTILYHNRQVYLGINNQKVKKDECGNDVFGYDSSGGIDQLKSYAAGDAPVFERDPVKIIR